MTRSTGDSVFSCRPYYRLWKMSLSNPSPTSRLLMMLRESYAPETPFPATFISDGTINIIALIVALYFEEHSVVMIEEPERNIHPHLISRVVEMLKDKAEKKQILVTTHSPEVVQHAGLENLLLISRHKDGYLPGIAAQREGSGQIIP